MIFFSFPELSREEKELYKCAKHSYDNLAPPLYSEKASDYMEPTYELPPAYPVYI